MEVELRRIAYNPRLDENSFAANLFVNGDKVATVNRKNGIIQYYPLNEDTAQVVTQAEEHFKKLPGEKKVIDGKEQLTKQNLSNYIEGLFAEHLANIERKKFDKKVELLAKRNVVIGEPGIYWRTHAMNGAVDVLNKGAGRDLLVETLAKKILPNMRENEIILNKNIPVEILKEAGLSEQQYGIETASKKEQKAEKKNRGLKP